MLHTRSKGATIMTTQDKPQMPLFSPEDEKETQKEFDRLSKRLRASEKGIVHTTRKQSGFEDKTLWDKFNLFGTLAIPIVVTLATIAFSFVQIYLADQQHQTDQRIAEVSPLLWSSEILGYTIPEGGALFHERTCCP
jgi:hypothetical protein